MADGVWEISRPRSGRFAKFSILWYWGSPQNFSLMHHPVQTVSHQALVVLVALVLETLEYLGDRFASQDSRLMLLGMLVCVICSGVGFGWVWDDLGCDMLLLQCPVMPCDTLWYPRFRDLQREICADSRLRRSGMREPVAHVGQGIPVKWPVSPAHPGYSKILGRANPFIVSPCHCFNEASTLLEYLKLKIFRLWMARIRVSFYFKLHGRICCWTAEGQDFGLAFWCALQTNWSTEKWTQIWMHFFLASNAVPEVPFQWHDFVESCGTSLSKRNDIIGSPFTDTGHFCWQLNQGTFLRHCLASTHRQLDEQKWNICKRLGQKQRHKHQSPQNGSKV